MNIEPFTEHTNETEIASRYGNEFGPRQQPGGY